MAGTSTCGSAYRASNQKTASIRNIRITQTTIRIVIFALACLIPKMSFIQLMCITALAIRWSAIVSNMETIFFSNAWTQASVTTASTAYYSGIALTVSIATIAEAVPIVFSQVIYGINNIVS